MSFAAVRFGRASARRRTTGIVMAGAVHILALGLALLARSEPQMSPRQNLVAFSVPGPEPAEQLRPKPVQPRKVPPVPPQPVLLPPPLIELPKVPELVASMLEQADAQSSGGACDLTAPVQAALRLSPEVQRDLPTIPARRRSVANAIALWNQDWVPPDTDLSEDALNSIRTTVVTTIGAASEACRLQPQGGPRLIYLPGEVDTVLVLGSGEWTWQQVADSAEQPQSTTGNIPQIPIPMAVDGDRKWPKSADSGR